MSAQAIPTFPTRFHTDHPLACRGCGRTGYVGEWQRERGCSDCLGTGVREPFFIDRVVAASKRWRNLPTSRQVALRPAFDQGHDDEHGSNPYYFDTDESCAWILGRRQQMEEQS